MAKAKTHQKSIAQIRKDRDRLIVKMRGNEKTLAEIAEATGLTHQRVSQIIKKSMEEVA